MITELVSVIKLNPEPQFHDAIRTLKDFSHLWVVFIFDRSDSEWRPLITPPRLDAPGRVGVFASRSPHRPNPIGISAVKIERIDESAPGGIEIFCSGLDLLNGTPVVDLKPYVPYVDAIPQAQGAWTESVIPKFEVKFSDEVISQIQALNDRYRRFHKGNLQALLAQMLELDPRPTSQREAYSISDPKNEGAKFAFRCFNFDVHWEIRERGIFVSRLDTQ